MGCGQARQGHEHLLDTRLRRGLQQVSHTKHQSRAYMMLPPALWRPCKHPCL